MRRRLSKGHHRLYQRTEGTAETGSLYSNEAGKRTELDTLNLIDDGSRTGVAVKAPVSTLALEFITLSAVFGKSLGGCSTTVKVGTSTLKGEV